jgi:hypothetical protein
VGKHSLFIQYIARNLGTLDAWNTPSKVVRITGFTVDPGETSWAQTLLPYRMFCLSASTFEGIGTLGDPSSVPGDARLEQYDLADLTTAPPPDDHEIIAGFRSVLNGHSAGFRRV